MDDCIVGVDGPVSDSTEDFSWGFSSEVERSTRRWASSESKKDVESSAGEDPEHRKGEKIGHTESCGGTNGESSDVCCHTGVGRAVVVVVATRAAWDAPMAMPADSGHKAVIRKNQKKEEENVRGGDEHRIQQRRITFEESVKLRELTRQGAVS